MFTKVFWQRTLERFIRAFAAAFVLTASAAEVIAGDGVQIELQDRLLIGLVQGIGAVALSLVGSQVGDHTSPSLLPSPPEPPLDSKGHFDPSEFEDGR